VRKVCVVVTARPSYSRVRSLLAALAARPDIELQIVVGCSALLERYGDVSRVMEADGFHIAERVWSVLEGENLLTGARETGIALMDFASCFDRLRPDLVVVNADRREVLAAAIAARYQEISVLHLQAGERTGSVDDAVRDAISHMATYFCVSTEMARYRVYGLTGDMTRVFVTGCPSLDVARDARDEPPVTVEELGGAGAAIDLSRPFICVLQHTTTDRASAGYDEMMQTLEALTLPAVVFWPGEEPGSAGISKAIRRYQGRVHTVRNLPPTRFLRLLMQSAALVGNSSCGIRECSYLGVPVVNVGTRQHGRERAANVVDVPHHARLIADAIEAQAAHGPYPSAGLYGRGDAGQQIAEVLCGLGKRVGACEAREQGRPEQEPAAARRPDAH
jgi:UDP-hydrolysing UDP-N-acetyl-D-glucosamine 2-epimerase